MAPPEPPRRLDYREPTGQPTGSRITWRDGARVKSSAPVAVVDGVAYSAHVGDSRLYLLRGKAVVQKTKDHTVAGERQRMGLVSADKVKDHPGRSILTRSLGRELIAAVDRLTFDVDDGDRL